MDGIAFYCNYQVDLRFSISFDLFNDTYLSLMDTERHETLAATLRRRWGDLKDKRPDPHPKTLQESQFLLKPALVLGERNWISRFGEAVHHVASSGEFVQTGPSVSATGDGSTVVNPTNSASATGHSESSQVI